MCVCLSVGLSANLSTGIYRSVSLSLSVRLSPTYAHYRVFKFNDLYQVIKKWKTETNKKRLKNKTSQGRGRAVERNREARTMHPGNGEDQDSMRY